MKRHCRKCDQDLSIEDFGKCARAKDKKKTVCKTCYNSYQSQWGQTHQTSKRKHLVKSKYGLSWEEYEQKFLEQDGTCAICKCSLQLFTFEARTKLETAHVDHSHSSGKVRGLLCARCNSGLGLFRDNEVILKNATEYLKKYNEMFGFRVEDIEDED
jgi:hypothetical protein